MDQLHGAATSILETVGLNVHHPVIRPQTGGCRRHPGQGLAGPPPAAHGGRPLGTAQRPVVIHNRLGQPTMPLGPHHVYFGLGSDLIYARDAETGERRLSQLVDVGRAASCVTPWTRSTS